MQNVILATERGGHLAPLTLFMPPAMVPVANKPVIEHLVEWLVQQGQSSVTVATHYMADQIERHLGDGQRWGMDIDYVLTRQAEYTADGLRRAARGDGLVLALNADMLFDLDLDRLVQAHRERQAQVTVVLWQLPSAAKAELDDSGRLLELGQAVTGVYLMNTGWIATMPADEPRSLAAYLQERIVQGDVVFGYPIAGPCYKLDSLDALLAAQSAALTAELAAAVLPGAQLVRGVWQGHHTRIHPSAILHPPVLLGEGCEIKAQVELGPNAVIGDRVIVDEGATITESVVLPGTFVGRLANLEQSIVRHNCLIKAPTQDYVFVADPFLLSSVESQLLGGSVAGAMTWLLALLWWIVTLPLWPVALALALFAGDGPVWTRIVRTTADPSARLASGQPGWRTVTARAWRADPATWAGRWLRRTGLASLPGLLDVLTGRLALIGVGPLSPDQAAALTEEWEQQRFLAPAGWTGLWYAQRRLDTDLTEQLATDSFYAVTRTWREDWRIIAQLPGAWLRQLLGRD